MAYFELPFAKIFRAQNFKLYLTVLIFTDHRCRRHALTAFNAVPPVNFKMAARGGPNWPTGSGKVSRLYK